MAQDADFHTRRTSFGAGAEGYDAYRPEWPPDVATWLTVTGSGDARAGRSLRVIDVGAGTGKLSRALARLGHRVLAVDPDEDMLAVLRRSTAAVETRPGTAEHLPAGDASVDAVTVAQAWHWVDPPAASAESARVLVPGGSIGIGWMVHDAAVPWIRELDDVVAYPNEKTADEWASTLGLGADFGTVERRTSRHEQRLSVDGVVGLVASWSYVATSPDRTAMLDAAARLAADAADPDGVVTVPHLVHCFRATRSP